MSRRLYYVIVRADGSARLVTRYPKLGADEVAFRLSVVLPAGWGLLQSPAIELQLPEGAPTLQADEEPLFPTADDEDDVGDAVG